MCRHKAHKPLHNIGNNQVLRVPSRSRCGTGLEAQHSPPCTISLVRPWIVSLSSAGAAKPGGEATTPSEREARNTVHSDVMITRALKKSFRRPNRFQRPDRCVPGHLDSGQLGTCVNSISLLKQCSNASALLSYQGSRISWQLLWRQRLQTRRPPVDIRVSAGI